MAYRGSLKNDYRAEIRITGGAALSGAIRDAARQALGPVIGGVAACVLAGVCTFNEEDGESNATAPTPPVPIPEGWKGDTCPAPDWTWSGPDEPGGAKGGWVSPDGNHSYHPDNNHEPPIGPHVDWNDRFRRRKWRIFPDGRVEPK